MCRTTLTVVHHACVPGHLTRNTRTEQCHAAYRIGARICAPGPPAHRTFEYHFPGGACQSCCEDADAETFNNQNNSMAAAPAIGSRGVEPPPHPPSTFPYHQPTLWNPDAFPQQFVAPAAVPPPPPFAQQARSHHRRGMPSIDEDDDGHDVDDDSANDRSAPAETPPHRRRRAAPPPQQPLQPTLRGGMSSPPPPPWHSGSDASSIGATADDDEDGGLREALQRSEREFAAREADEARRAAAQSLREYGDAEKAALEWAMRESAMEGGEARRSRQGDEEREMALLLERSAEEARRGQEADVEREVARLMKESAEEYWRGAARLQGTRELGEDEEREVLRRSVQTWREEVGRERETVYTMRCRFACGHEVKTGAVRVREGEEEAPEVRFEDVPGRCADCERAGAYSGRGSVAFGGAGDSVSETASYSAGIQTPTSTGGSFQEKPYQGKDKQRADPGFSLPPPPWTPIRTLRPRPSGPPVQPRSYPPQTTVDDYSETAPSQPSETWPSERIDHPREQDDVSTIMDPAAEVARAMDAVQMSLNSTEDIRKARLARFGAQNARKAESEV